jgi:hypothetical protein
MIVLRNPGSGTVQPAKRKATQNCGAAASEICLENDTADRPSTRISTLDGEQKYYTLQTGRTTGQVPLGLSLTHCSVQIRSNTAMVVSI